MFVTLTAIAMAAFGLGTWLSARRRGLNDGISRRPYGNIYSDAAGARRDMNPRRVAPGLLDRPFWARVSPAQRSDR
jgi:hypothetical protein